MFDIVENSPILLSLLNLFCKFTFFFKKLFFIANVIAMKITVWFSISIEFAFYFKNVIKRFLIDHCFVCVCFLNKLF